MESRLQYLIPEIQNFLKQIENTALSKPQQRERDDLLKKIANLLNDFPDQLKLSLDSVSIKSEKSNEDFEGEIYEICDETEAKPAERRASEPANNISAISDVLKGCRMSGNLTRKNASKGKFDIQNFVSKLFGKKFCVVKQGVLYIFDKNTSKKHDHLIVLKGYDVRNVFDKREFVFELVSPGKPTYMFSTSSNSDRSSWVNVLENEVLVTADTKSVLEEETVESTDEINANDDENVEEIYDDIAEKPSQTINTNKKMNNIFGGNLKNSCDDHIQEIYEDEASMKPKTKVKDVQAKIFEGEVKQSGCRYDGLFYGLWDCRADAKDELAFKQGDVIEILGKDYEKFGWWVGKLDGKVGIVPREYLSPAYRMIEP